MRGDICSVAPRISKMEHTVPACRKDPIHDVCTACNEIHGTPNLPGSPEQTGNQQLGAVQSQSELEKK